MVRPTDGIQVAALARLTGTNPHSLRAWERRYGVLRPQRTTAGYRLYGPDDVRRVELMAAHVAAGTPAGAAARLALEAVPMTEMRPGAPELPALKARMVAAFAALDESAAHVAFQDALAVTTTESALLEVALPALLEVNGRWDEGRLGLTFVHFASHAIRADLLRLATGWDQGTGPVAWLACPHRELHDIPAVAFGVLLHERGWRIRFLGSNSPLPELAEAAARRRPDVVVLSAERGSVLRRAEGDLRRIAAAAPLALGGRGVTRALAHAVGAHHLDGALGEEAAQLDRRLGTAGLAPVRREAGTAGPAPGQREAVER